MLTSRVLMNKVCRSNKSSSLGNQIKVQQHDNGIKIFLNITKDSFIEPINGAVVHLRLMDKRNNIVMNRVCDITDFEIAECLYVLTSDDTKHSGTYNTEVQVNYANGTILSIENPFTIIVYPETIPWESSN